MFARLGRWCHDHRRIVLAAWIVTFVALGFVAGSLGSESRSELALPDVESQRGLEILEEKLGGMGAGDGGTLVVTTEVPVTDPSVRPALEALFADAGELTVEVDGTEQPLDITSPFSPEGQAQIAPAPVDGTYVAYATVGLPPDTTFEAAQTVGEDLRARIATAEADVDGLQVVVGGQLFSEFEQPQAELIGLAFAIVILILAFGSVLAMGLPIGVALFGIGVGTTLVGLLSHVITIPDFATTLGMMIGLGVGIDYTLFIVTRYRENLHARMDSSRATTVAIDTSGRAVVFAGMTVVISLLGMVVMQLSFVTGLAVSAAMVVAVTMVGSITLLPTLIGFARHRIEITRVRGLVAAALVALALLALGLKAPAGLAGAAILLAGIVLVVGSFLPVAKREVSLRSHKAHDQTLSYRWSRTVQRHPVVSLVAGLTFLLFLALPVLGLRLGFPDDGNAAEGSDTRVAYDTLADAFGPGSNGPLLLATDLPAGTTPEEMAAVTAGLEADDGIVAVMGPITNDLVDPSLETPTAAIWRITPSSAPQDEATTDLVSRIRDDIVPAATAGTELDPAVTGSVAINIDFSEYLSSRLVWFFGAVLGLSFLLLMAVFRSLLVPLKAVLMNLVSIGAAFGVVVAGFQWGWLGGLMSFDGAPVEPFIPMMLFAIVFGLSMDYEVFLLSRVREEWLRTGDSHLSVANGLAATARVITAAALIMVAVFGGFMLENDRTIRLFGMGLATAVFLDATVVRMLLVPATMELLGDRNWWLPGWLDRILPNIDVEGHVDDEADDDHDGDADASGAPERELAPV